MIRDRGRIKWAPFLIPEHKTRIAKLYEAEENVRKPVLDEQKLEELQEKISEAIEFGSSLVVSFYKNRRFESVTGKIKAIDQISSILQLNTAYGDVKIPFQSIIEMHVH